MIVPPSILRRRSGTTPPPTTAAMKPGVINDNDRYTAFPAVVTVDNNPFAVSKDSTNHASKGPAMTNRAPAGIWSAKVQMKVDGVLQEIATLGLGISGSRILFAYQPDYNAMDPYPFVSFAYCDDGTENFISAGNVNKRAGEDFVSGFGKIIKMPEGELWYPVYASDATHAILYFMESTDNGVSWHSGPDIYSCLKDTTGMSITDIITAGVGSLSELYVAIVQAGVSNATTKLVCCVRNDSLYSGGAHYLFSSDNGGGAWSYHGLVTAERLGSDGGNPMTVHVRAPNIHFIAGQREATTYGGLGYNFNICRIDGIALSAYNNPAALSPKRFLAKGVTGYKANGADFGYPEIFDFDGVDWIMYYDHSIKSKGGADTLKRIREIIIPLLPRPYLETIATANQSIPNATSTPLDTPAVLLDSVGMYLAGTFTVKGDQIGIASMRLNWDPSNSGTYRQAIIKCGTKFQARKVIAPDTNARFCSINFKSIPFSFADGDVIQFLVEHDATGALNVLNTELQKNAMITYQKINDLS